MKAYIAGPMTNRPHFNFPTFDAVAAYLRRHGWEIFNPHEHDQDVYPGIDDAPATQVGDVKAIVDQVGFNLQESMRWDLARVIESDAIVLLPEWETSTGATHERYVAEVTGRKVLLADSDCDGNWFVYSDLEQVRVTRKPEPVA